MSKNTLCKITQGENVSYPKETNKLGRCQHEVMCTNTHCIEVVLAIFSITIFDVRLMKLAEIQSQCRMVCLF